MTLSYCNECKKIMFGGLFPSADKDITLFNCRYCGGVTCTESKDYEFDLIDHDIILRNESIKLQRRKYEK
jgi:hypothetical protein